MRRRHCFAHGTRVWLALVTAYTLLAQTDLPTKASPIRPPGVTVNGAGISVQDWQVQQGLQGDNGRTYNYLVDRDTERW